MPQERRSYSKSFDLATPQLAFFNEAEASPSLSTKTSKKRLSHRPSVAANATRLLDGYCGYLMTDDYAGYNALGAQDGVERLGCWAHARRKFVEAQKVQPKGKTGRADIALKLISKLYGIEIAFKESSDEGRKMDVRI
jgi:hypothetical protein